MISLMKRSKIRGTVVQLVRAPPCHGGSCGFESRQSRGKHRYELINIKFKIQCEINMTNVVTYRY